MKLIQPKDNLNEKYLEVINANHFLTIEMQIYTNDPEHPKPYAIIGYTLDEENIELARYYKSEFVCMKEDFLSLTRW